MRTVIAIFVFLAAMVGSCEKLATDNGTSSAAIENPLIPEHEMRGVWVATVTGLDWPQEIYSEKEQKQLYIDYLDLFSSLNINTVFFQVRPTADAFYESEYEPWCGDITGQAGQAPSYDVMKFLIDETHERGMQFHAWINPYRIATRDSSSVPFPALDPKIPSELTKDYQRIRVYNPALPEVRQRIADIVKDLIVKYDIDGIHMDDYFYPSLQKGETFGDDADFEKYGEGFSDINDWRRDNVTRMVSAISDVVKSTRPEVIFSISPAGNYDNNYNKLFIDVPHICSEGLIDVLVPQLYWSTTAPKDYYTPRLDWFTSNISSTSMLVGYAAYRFNGKSAGFTDASELKTEFDLAAAKENVIGGVFFSAKSLTGDKIGINDVIRSQYSHPALVPCVKADNTAPVAPENLKFRRKTLRWDTVEGAKYYAVYKCNGSNEYADLLGTTEDNSYFISTPGAYFITALSATNAESCHSMIISRLK